MSLRKCVVCSHARSWQFYAESVERLTKQLPFIANKCSDGVKSFKNSNCVGPETASMGYYANGVGSIGLCEESSKLGNYFVETNKSPPFSKDNFRL